MTDSSRPFTHLIRKMARMERVAFVITDIGQMMASLQTQVEALVAFQLTDRTRVEMLHPPGGGGRRFGCGKEAKRMIKKASRRGGNMSKRGF